jgi:hypothetical protein
VLPDVRPPDSPRGTARPVVVPDPPVRRCSAASARSMRSGRTGSRSRTGALAHGADEPSELDPEEPPLELDEEPALGEDELDEPESPPPPRGTAEPTVSPFDGRDDCCSPCGRPRSSWAQADPTLSVNAAATSPIENV